MLKKSTPEIAEIVAQIRAAHRRRRFAMKIQQKLDRALESFIRLNANLGWSPDLDADARAKINAEVKKIIKAARSDATNQWHDVVGMSDAARGPADEWRRTFEREMEHLAETLPVHSWIDSIHGAGALGLATIVAEAGDLSNYANPAKLWSRLGFAPFEGLAGSSWKRDSWRPRALTAEEWTEHPFSGERYALMHQIIVWLVNAQWIGAKKTESGEGKPDGPYGETYFKRREHTKKTNPDWSDGHRRMDALRVSMKAFLAHLWGEWNDASMHTDRRGRRKKEPPPMTPRKRRP